MERQRFSDLIPGFHLDMGEFGYDLICVNDAVKADRKPGIFVCPECGNSVDSAVVKTITFGFYYGVRCRTELERRVQLALKCEGFKVTGSLTGRMQLPEPSFKDVYKKVQETYRSLNYAIQANFAELESNILAAAALAPDHKDEEVRSEKDDAGHDSNSCAGSCMCKSTCSGNED